MEIWKDVKNYENLYQVSNLGRVKRLTKQMKMPNGGFRLDLEKIMITTLNKDGYPRLNLSNNGKSTNRKVHQLVAEAFLNHIPNGLTIVVNHIDHNRQNNNVDNLELVTMRGNSSHKKRKYTSDFVGVSWCNFYNKWNSRITLNKKYKNLGYFLCEEAASKAYQEALKKFNDGN